MNLKEFAKITGKFLFAAILITWLVKSGRLDFSFIPQSFNYPQNWALALCLLGLNILVTGKRWQLIMQTKMSGQASFFQFIQLTWIGLLFNVCLPGAVSGDFIKLIYAKKLDQNLSKTFLLISVLIDRIIGLVGLIFILGATSFIFYSELISFSEEIKGLIFLNYTLFFVAVLFLLSLFASRPIQSKILHLCGKLPFMAKTIQNILANTWHIGESKKTIFKTIGLSLLAQILFGSALWVLTKPFYGQELSLFHAFSFIPVGLMSMAIPITPAGLGIGHAVFDTLFGYFGIRQGASLFNLFFVGYIGMNCLGLLPYLFSNFKPSKADIEQFQNTPSKSEAS